MKPAHTDEITRQQHERLDRIERQMDELEALARQLAAKYGIVVEDTNAEQVSA